MRTQPRIFVNIASYRDPECQWTVKDLYEKAKYPDRIFVGICWQFDPLEDQHCFEVTTRPDQVRIMPVDWREAEGVCWARYQTQQLWEGEEYTFMTDSHMRFVPGWDELMIDELARCESDKPLLSSSPASYEPPNKLGTMMKPTFRRVKPFSASGNMRCQAEAFDRYPPHPIKGAFVVCNNIFSRSDVTPEVPYDPYLYFDQEEITYSARLYTHGWDVFSASRQFLYHYYNTPKSVRPLHWTDLRKKEEERIKFYYERGLRRFNHLTRHQLTDDKRIIVDIEKYGFGTARTLDQFEEFTGIDFKRKIATDRAMRGLFIEDLAKYRDRPVRVPEIDDRKPVVTPTKMVVTAAKGIAQPAKAATKQKPTPDMQGLIVGKKTAQHLPTLLEPGDFIPLFQANDTNKVLRSLEVYAGRHMIMVFLPMHNLDAARVFFAELENQTAAAKLTGVWQVFVLNETVENLIEFKKSAGIRHLLWADPDGSIARSLGVARKGEAAQPCGFVVSPNMQILSRHILKGPANLAADLVRDCVTEVESYREKYREPKVIASMPPALIVPNVFSPEFCRKCIDAFHEGHTFDGKIGMKSSNEYKPDTKMRTDHIVGGALLEEIDYKLSRSFFPEIEKVFGFKVTHRELYKIGLYKGEKQGFFKQHRDNFDAPLGYRRVASTIHLSDDYEGGGLRFPEYGEDIYRPPLGGGIAFSCQTMHEARPVTRGERYILVAFVHGDEDEAYRRAYLHEKGDPLKVEQYNTTLREYPELHKSRDFYKEWYDKNVQINWEGKDKK